MKLGGLALGVSVVLRAATFHQDILPILERRCQSCHRPGQIAPMPFLNYQQVRPWAKSIREAVRLKKMPPWFVESASVKFDNDPRLTPEEIVTIEAWVNAGAPEGRRSETHAPKTLASSWNIPQPDLHITMPQPVHVPAAGQLDYQFIILPLDQPQDRWVEAAEIRPGRLDAVHHVVAYVREPGSDWLKGAPTGKPFARSGVTTSDILAIYAPGQPAMICRPGMAKKLPKGSDIVLQIHYTPNGKAGDDRTSIGLVWSGEPPSQRVLTLQIATTDIRIPPGEANYRVTASGTMPNDALLLSMFPHMHLRGKAFEYAIVEAGGRVDTLLRVAPYHFNWQLNYRLAEPRRLPKGTRLRCTAWYDNSPNNPRNPDPSVEVTYGEQSDQEMMVGFFDVAVPASMDKPAFFMR